MRVTLFLSVTWIRKQLMWLHIYGNRRMRNGELMFRFADEDMKSRYSELSNVAHSSAKN